MNIDGFSIETTPGGARKVGSFAALVPQGTRVFVTHLPDGARGDIVRTAARLVGAGMAPVPHIGARHLESRGALERHLDALRSVGVREALLIGGDRSEPRGPFSQAGDLVEPAAARFERLYFAGHPEEDRDAALLDKIVKARAAGAEAAIVTQFVFEADAVLDWERRLGRLGNTAPIRVGLPGVASPGALLKYAKMCGVGRSLRGLWRDGRLLRMAGRWTPAAPIAGLSDAPASVEGLHFFPFGGFAETAAYLAEARLVPSERRWNQS